MNHYIARFRVYCGKHGFDQIALFACRDAPEHYLRAIMRGWVPGATAPPSGDPHSAAVVADGIVIASTFQIKAINRDTWEMLTTLVPERGPRVECFDASLPKRRYAIEYRTEGLHEIAVEATSADHAAILAYIAHDCRKPAPTEIDEEAEVTKVREVPHA
ncbi:MAG TPA: hypothetical protein PK264_05265 [Hyphomicrobiaceae bacterium]|nr:hypothetical protein [Hyphomicrobiaceae bacterium]